ncbi:hypothetical protein ACTXT7_012295 [Hymenolepis weldensis]
MEPVAWNFTRVIDDPCTDQSIYFYSGLLTYLHSDNQTIQSKYKGEQYVIEYEFLIGSLYAHVGL